MGWGWALIRGWALINFFHLKDGRLFEVGANSRLGAYSNKYGNTKKALDKNILKNLENYFVLRSGYEYRDYSFHQSL